MQFSPILAVCTILGLAYSHMQIQTPPPFRAKNNAFVDSGSVDYSMTAPLKADGSDFPCKGYHKDLGTPAGASVATWASGDLQNFTVTGGASHGGGSCQASLSYDKGASFTVIHSYMGDCPTAAGGSFPFKIPEDAPAGSALFAWTWFNKIGNREMYMNCASITITAGASKGNSSTTTFSSRPAIAVMNLNNGCTTPEGFDVCFASPGPDVTDTSQSHSTASYPVGTCKAVNGIATGSGASSAASGSVASSSVPSQSSSIIISTSTSLLGATSQSPSGFVTSYTSKLAASSTSSSSTASASVALSGNSTISPDGSCKGLFTCNGSPSGNCCSQYGWCGITDSHCLEGCNPLKGSCSSTGTTASPLPATSSINLSGAISTTASPSPPTSSINLSGTMSTMTLIETSTLTITDLAGEVTVIPVSGSMSILASTSTI